MPKQSISFLKSLFVTGNKPTQGNFWDWLDSFVHKDDISAVNQSVINAAINQYDSGLKIVSADGVVNTLGDVFKVFQNYSDTRNIAAELTWSGLPGRPTEPIALGYTNIQRIVMSQYSWLFTGGTSSSRIKSLKQLAGAAAETPIVIVDMQFIANTFVDTYGQTIAVFGVNAVDIGINPRITV